MLERRILGNCARDGRGATGGCTGTTRATGLPRRVITNSSPASNPIENLAQVRLGFGQCDRYDRFHRTSPYLIM